MEQWPNFQLQGRLKQGVGTLRFAGHGSTKDQQDRIPQGITLEKVEPRCDFLHLRERLVQLWVGPDSLCCPGDQSVELLPFLFLHHSIQVALPCWHTIPGQVQVILVERLQLKKPEGGDASAEVSRALRGASSSSKVKNKQYFTQRTHILYIYIFMSLYVY